jgi:hypothetical protein
MGVVVHACTFLHASVCVSTDLYAHGVCLTCRFACKRFALASPHSSVLFNCVFLRPRQPNLRWGTQGNSPTSPESPVSPDSTSLPGPWSNDKQKTTRSNKARDSPTTAGRGSFPSVSPREREEQWVGTGRRKADMVASSARVSNHLAEVRVCVCVCVSECVCRERGRQREGSCVRITNFSLYQIILANVPPPKDTRTHAHTHTHISLYLSLERENN